MILKKTIDFFRRFSSYNFCKNKYFYVILVREIQAQEYISRIFLIFCFRLSGESELCLDKSCFNNNIVCLLS